MESLETTTQNTRIEIPRKLENSWQQFSKEYGPIAPYATIAMLTLPLICTYIANRLDKKYQRIFSRVKFGT